MAKFKADLDAKKYKGQIESETKEGQAVGVNGTPAVFINGRKISGAYPFDTFKKIADEELAKKKAGAKAHRRDSGQDPPRAPRVMSRAGRTPRNGLRTLGIGTRSG